MNVRMTIYILGILLFFEGVFMAVPTATAAVYHEKELPLFAAIAGFCILAGVIITRFKPTNKKLFARDGFVIVALSWVVLSLFGALPFFFPERFRISWTRCLKRFPDLRQPVRVFCMT